MTTSRMIGEIGNYIFKVKQHSDGSPWLVAVPQEAPEIPFFRNAALGIHLSKETTLGDAQRIADTLNANLFGVGLTLFEQHPAFGIFQDIHRQG